jgi:hypothetical protein
VPESDKHLELVQCIVGYITNVYIGIDSVATLRDLPGTVRGNKPPKIGEYRPDIYAIDAPLTRTIVGEAKTQTDLETDHTRRQFHAFMSFLRLQPKPVFIVAVPWQAKARGRNLLEKVAKELDASEVEIVVLDEVRTDVD